MEAFVEMSVRGSETSPANHTQQACCHASINLLQAGQENMYELAWNFIAQINSIGPEAEIKE